MAGAVRYHINNEGECLRCEAQTQECQYDSNAGHFETRQEGAQAAEKFCQDKYGESYESVKRKKKAPKPTPKELERQQRIAQQQRAQKQQYSEGNYTRDQNYGNRSSNRPPHHGSGGGHYGVFKTGEVSQTKDQRKRHVSQMTYKEKVFIKSAVAKNFARRGAPKPSRHVLQKVEDGEFSLDRKELQHMLENPTDENIVEYNHTSYGDGNRSNRVLLRSTRITNVDIETRDGRVLKDEPCNMCISVDLNRNTIVTGYWNSAKDAHSSINMNRYDDKLPISFS